MRGLIVPAAIAVSLSLAPTAFAAAAHTATGQIKTFDTKAHSITLSNGKTYMLPAALKTDGIKPGAKVQVDWVVNGKNYNATSVKLLK